MRLYVMVGLGMAIVAIAGGAMTERLVSAQLDTRAAVANGRHAAEMARATLVAATKVSAERGPTNGLLGADLPQPPERLKALADARKATDDALAAALAAISTAGANGFEIAVPAQALRTSTDRLAGTRKGIDALASRPRPERGADEVSALVNGMIAVIPELNPALNRIEVALVAADPALTDFATIARLATDLRDLAGQLGSVFTPALVTRRPMEGEEIAKLERLSGKVEALEHYLRLACAKIGGDPGIQQALESITRRYLGAGLATVAKLAAVGRSSGDYGLSAADFAGLYVPEMASIVDLREVAVQRIFDRVEALRVRNERALLATVITAMSVLTGIALVFGVIAVRMLRPLAVISGSLRQMAAGDTEVAIPISGRKDEIGDLIGALRTLQTVVEEREQGNWLRVQVSAMAERLQVTDSYADFGAVLMSGIGQRLDIVYGAFFVVDRETGRVSRVGGYAIDQPERARDIPLGDGLVGQVAVDGRPIETDVSHLEVTAGCGSVRANRIVIIPVLRLDEVVAVIELAPLQPLTDRQRALIDALLPAVSTNLQILSAAIRSRRLFGEAGVSPAEGMVPGGS